MNLVQEMTPRGRVYVTPEGNRYPSVTTVLSKMKDKSFLVEWEKRVGKEEAARIKNAAANRGTHLHKMIENRFLGNEVVSENDTARRLYRQISPQLERIQPLHLEIPLYSDNLKLAGCADFIGYYDGVLSLIDFKTSIKEKLRAWVKDYFIQATLYSLMAYERLGLECKQIIILMATEEGCAQVFKERVGTHAKEAISIVRSYHSKYGS